MMTSNELRGWRAAKRWTQEQAAEALGYSRRAYQTIEVTPGEISQLLRLAVTGYEATVARPVVRSLANLTLGDMSDEENVKNAEYELGRATTDAMLADWARRWGRACVERCRDVAGREESESEALEALEKEMAGTEQQLRDVSAAGSTLIKALDSAYDKHPEMVTRAIAALENNL